MRTHLPEYGRSLRPEIVVLSEAEIRQSVRLGHEALAAVEPSFGWLSSGSARSQILVLKFPERRGQVDIKTAPAAGQKRFAIKIATGFYENSADGLPNASGMMALVNTYSGFPEALLLDNGYLTHLRTALAGAVAAKYLAADNISTVGVVGAGLQARLQIQALALVRTFDTLLVYSPRPKEVEAYATEMHASLGIQVVPAALQALVERSDVVVTTTPSKRALVQAAWLHPGIHITAMGSDTDEKQELEGEVLSRADIVCCDDRVQCARIGELRHAVAAGFLEGAGHPIELGELVLGTARGRTSEDEITVCDLTGVGVQDTAIAVFAYERALAAGLGLRVQG